MKQTIPNLLQENGAFLMIIQNKIMMQQMKLPIIQKFNLCDYNDAYILARVDITVIAALAVQEAFKNCAPFTKYITSIDEDDA